MSLQPSGEPSRQIAPFGSDWISSIVPAMRAFSSLILVLFWSRLIKYLHSPLPCFPFASLPKIHPKAIVITLSFDCRGWRTPEQAGVVAQGEG